MIKFNEVTWYSKLASIIFFIGVLPILTFYIGTQYQDAKNINENVVFESTVAKRNSRWKTYTNNDFNFSLMYPKELEITKDDSFGTELKYITSNTNPFIIKRTERKGYDSNGKFGSVTYYYENGQWMFIGPESARDGSQPPPTPTKPIFRTTSGLPVFNGAIPTHGWGRYSYIVALSNAKFLTIEGGDEDGVLINLVKSVKVN